MARANTIRLQGTVRAIRGEEDRLAGDLPAVAGAPREAPRTAGVAGAMEFA